MAKAYSDDLRRRVLEAHERGEGTLEELAERFSVSLGWVGKISAAYTRTGGAVCKNLGGGATGGDARRTAVALVAGQTTGDQHRFALGCAEEIGLAA